MDVLVDGQCAALVLQQHHALLGGAAGQGDVLLGAYLLLAHVVVGALRVVVDDAQLQARHHQRLQGAVDVVLGEQLLAEGVLQGAEGGAALHVQARLDGDGAGLGLALRYLVAVVDVGDGAAVGDDVPLEAPLLAQDVGEQQLAARGALAVDAVVGPHDDFHLRLLHQHLEGRQVGLPEVVLRRLHIGLVARGLRSAVHGVVLAAGRHLQVDGVIALHAAHEGAAHGAGEEGVLAPGLHATPPARVAEDVHVRAPERKARIARVVLVAAGHHILGSRLGGNGVANLLHRLGVERGGQADGLGEDGGASAAAHAVQALVPPVVGLDA